MALWNYTEYTNGACANYVDYYNSYYCSANSHSNYINQVYKNHSNGGSATYHNNYTNQSHRNYTNYYICYNYTNHHNHTNYNMSDKGAAITLVWSSPWGGTSGNRTLDEDYITNSIDAIKQLRDNIGGNLDSPSNVSLIDKLSYWTDPDGDIAVIDDDTFDDGDPGTNEYIIPLQNNNLKSNLDELWETIRTDDDGSTPGTNDVVTSDLASKTDWELLASKADQLASYADPSYKNHVDYADKGAGGSIPD